MVLSDIDLRARLIAGELVKNVDWDDVQPASIELHLGQYLRDPRTGDSVSFPVAFEPGAFMLAATREVVMVPPDLVAVVDGKSTHARRGLMVHVTAGYVDPGFRGEITLELVNVSRDSVLLQAGMKIAQIRFHTLVTPCERPYGSKGLGSHYQDQRGPTMAIEE